MALRIGLISMVVALAANRTEKPVIIPELLQPGSPFGLINQRSLDQRHREVRQHASSNGFEFAQRGSHHPRLRVLLDHLRGLLRDHQHRRAGIARDDARHDRGIDHAQPGDAMHTQTGIHDGITALAHGTGTHRMEDGGANLTRRALQIFFTAIVRARLVFLRLVTSQCRRGNDAPGQANRIGRHL